ncbi:glycosyltransferase N-terminal domain-containing protein [Cognatishimia sp. WU-CL00825]|uniref:3-deoxy-D-manno-octulosonic acid transferase n=1 Tax=Cognatishimia sp. WU-CL00825 TaxID=3127658 RepID=UPI003109A615
MQQRPRASNAKAWPEPTELFDKMASSLSLTAYLAFARREPLSAPIQREPRPAGTVIWLHCADPARATAMAQLGLRLAAQRGGNHQVVLSLSPGRFQSNPMPDGVILVQAPSENPADILSFLAHWRPDVGLWIGPWVRPALIFEAQRRKIPLFLIDADELGLENKRWRWLPDSLNATLPMFTQIFARNAASGFRLRKAVGNDTVVEDSGPLLEDSPALSCNESDLDELSECLKTRPVWLAARVHPDEVNLLLNAHRNTSRLSPRLLLILVPDDPANLAALRDKCQDEGWRLGCWDDGDLPEEKTQILLAENPQELGLFYRIAPITFLGSSLVAGQGGRNPLEPAALGSAILYGPGVRRHLDAYTRLAKSGAARIVKDTNTLSAALAQLMAPDKVAQMVHAGWETVSEGALVVDRIVDQVSDALDKKGER